LCLAPGSLKTKQNDDTPEQHSPFPFFAEQYIAPYQELSRNTLNVLANLVVNAPSRHEPTARRLTIAFVVIAALLGAFQPLTRSRSRPQPPDVDFYWARLARARITMQVNFSGT